jgi:aerobic carbon-monoxide dehydrogenase large subunit
VGTKQFGARVQRLEDPALLVGRGQYTDDIKLPGTLHAVFVRSPHAAATLRGIDASAALALPGVHAVFTAADLPQPMRTMRMPQLVPNAAMQTLRTQHCLVFDEICHVGQAVAVVLADTQYIAEDGADRVSVDYDVRQALNDVRDALKPGAALVHPDLGTNIVAAAPMSYGDVDTAFANAKHVFEERIWQHRGGGNALETRAVLANYDPMNDLLTVWSATQVPHTTRRMIAELMGRNLDQIRVIAPDVGGGFGPKATMYCEDTVIAEIALQLRRPIKWVEDRREHFLCATQERDQYWDVSIAVDDDARILGVRGHLLHDTGAYLPWGIIMPYIAATTMPGPYVISAYRLDMTVAFTNKVPTTPVRGAGRPQAVFAMERLMDRVARELKLDPAEVRRRNFIKPEQMPYPVGLIFRDGKPLVYDSGDYPKAQQVALELSHYSGFKQRQAEALKQGRYIGVGIANYVEGTGLGPFEGVTVRVLPDGKVRVISGATNQGQGTRTTLSQIVADAIGCRMEDIVMTLGDTATIANGLGAFASRQAVNAGSSARIAGLEVRKQILRVAARHLGAPEDQIDLEDGMAISRSGNRQSISFGRLSFASQGMPGFSMEPGDSVGLEHTAFYMPPQAAYCSGTHVAEVEVNIGTGGVKVTNYVVAHDCGNVINPLIVDGQVQGGVAHGIGNALLEFMQYDENAQPITVTFADYLMPMATDVPDCIIEHVETPCPLNPIGVKGAGEGGTIPAAAAIVAAVEDALLPFGVTFSDTPLLPDKIVASLTAANAYRRPRQRN